VTHAEASVLNSLAPAAFYDQYTINPSLNQRLPAYRIPDPKLPDNMRFEFSEMKACAAGSLALAIVHAWQRAGVPVKDRFVPSVPFIYWYARYLDAVEGRDAPVVLSNAIRACIYKGFCPDKLFSVAEVKGDFRLRPSDKASEQALKNGVLHYAMVTRDGKDIAHCIAWELPVLMRIVIHNKAKSPAKGYAWATMGQDDAVGHCVLLVGYDLSGATEDDWYFLARDYDAPTDLDGCRQIPYSKISDAGQTSDFWVLTDVAPPEPRGRARKVIVKKRDVGLTALVKERQRHEGYRKKFTGWVQDAITATTATNV
jgi:hypothetical protein